MPIVSVEDNRSRKFREVSCSGDRNEAFSDLQNIANYSIKELVESNSKLLIFPNCLKKVRDKFDDDSVCDLKGSFDTEKHRENAEIKTGNVMGYVGYGNTELRIHSRFAKSDDGDYFLHYMLQKVFSINIFDFKVAKDDESVFDFLLYLFPHYLKRALSQGVYKEYQNREYNDSRVRGPVDVNRHIRFNIPFNGKIAYRTREYVTDNRITELVRHTVEYISATKMSWILSNDRETRDNVSKIRAATLSYNSHERPQIIRQNLKPIRNPYFSEYTILQRLCINILNHKKLKYGQNKDEVYGVLFDGAWLWEEYLWTVLHKAGFEHPENKMGKGRWYLFEGNKYPRYPDFYNESVGLVLDAKYKKLAYVDDEDRLNRNVSRDDFHQMIAYMYISQYKSGGFIFPDSESNLEKNSGVHEVGSLNGYGGNISLYGFPVPNGGACKDYNDFCGQMKLVEESLKFGKSD